MSRIPSKQIPAEHQRPYNGVAASLNFNKPSGIDSARMHFLFNETVYPGDEEQLRLHLSAKDRREQRLRRRAERNLIADWLYIYGGLFGCLTVVFGFERAALIAVVWIVARIIIHLAP